MIGDMYIKTRVTIHEFCTHLMKDKNIKTVCEIYFGEKDTDKVLSLTDIGVVRAEFHTDGVDVILRAAPVSGSFRPASDISLNYLTCVLAEELSIL